jgi:hypothetical protein
VTAEDRPHLHRANYHAPRAARHSTIGRAVLGRSGSEALFFGAVGDGCDVTDNQMARKYLSERYSKAELDRQLTRMRRAACSLVDDTRREIGIVARALLRYGTLDNDQIAELVASSVSIPET